MSVIDGFDLNNFNFMEWDYLAIYEVKVIIRKCILQP